MEMKLALLLALYGLLNFHNVDGFGGGAPANSAICTSMIPSHGPNSQAGRSPYSVTLSQTSVQGGKKILVTLNAAQGESFKGFLIQAKKAGKDNANKNYGTFVTRSSNTHTISCFEQKDSAVTHADNKDKNSVSVDWVAPNENFDGDLFFMVTFVKEYNTFWAHEQHSEALTVTRDPNLTTPKPAEPISGDTAARLRDAYSNCDVRGCLGLPDGCIDAFHSSKDSPNPAVCDVLLTWSAKGDKNEYNLTGRLTSGYLAMAFSEDSKMGHDSVVGCFFNQGQPQVSRFYNDGKSNTKVEDPQAGIKNAAADALDGYLFCKFEQDDHSVKGLTVAPREKYYYLVAKGGSASPNGLNVHDTKTSSSRAMDATEVGVVGAKDSSRLLYQLHGSFMIVAWLLLASTGMFTARYFKLTHTDVMPFKKALWFVIHLTCMFSTVFLTICGAIFIIIKKEGFTFMQGSDLMWHPVLGVILFGLALFQVFIAFLRPHPGTKWRPLFNWVHWTVGNSAHIVGIACIFLANDLIAAEINDDIYVWIMMGAVLYHIVMHLILSFQTLWADNAMDAKTKRAVVPGPMKPNGLSSEAPGSGFRTVLLTLYFLGLLGCSAALIYFVFRKKEIEVIVQ